MSQLSGIYTKWNTLWIRSRTAGTEKKVPQVPGTKEKMACCQPTEVSRNERLGSIISCHVWRLATWMGVLENTWEKDQEKPKRLEQRR